MATEKEVKAIKKHLKETYIQKHIAKCLGKNKDIWCRIMNGKMEFKQEYIDKLYKLGFLD